VRGSGISPDIFSGLVDMRLAYVVISDSCGPPETLDRAYPFLENKAVAFGFPDIIFTPEDIFQQLLRHMAATNADVVLGLYRAHDYQLMDMVDVDEHGHIHSMVLKPTRTTLSYAWLCGVWTPIFTEFMHDCLGSEELKSNRAKLADRKIDAQGDLPMGAVLQAAIRKGLRVDGLRFPNATYIDIGTPDDLVKAVGMLQFRQG
jgi:dTDP-glucose pyrophosphorylase